MPAAGLRARFEPGGIRANRKVQHRKHYGPDLGAELLTRERREKSLEGMRPGIPARVPCEAGRQRVRAEWGVSPEGRRRRYYQITDAGGAQLAEQRKQWATATRTLGGLWGLTVMAAGA